MIREPTFIGLLRNKNFYPVRPQLFPSINCFPNNPVTRMVLSPNTHILVTGRLFQSASTAPVMGDGAQVIYRRSSHH